MTISDASLLSTSTALPAGSPVTGRSMKVAVKRLLLGTICGVSIGLASPAHANLVLVDAFAPGVDPDNIRVGDSYHIYTLLEGSTAGEHLVAESGGAISAGGGATLRTYQFGSTSNADFTTDAILFDFTFLAYAAGPASMMVDFSRGAIQSNLAVYSPTANTLSFNIRPAAVPEPGSLALLGIGLTGLVSVGGLRKRRADQAESPRSPILSNGRG